MSQLTLQRASIVSCSKLKNQVKVSTNIYYKISPISYRYRARVVELVDTRDLKSLAEKRAGSSPAPGTIFLIDYH